MWPIPIPADQVPRAYRTCIDSIANEEIRARLDAAEPLVIEATRRFEGAAREACLYLLDPKLFAPESLEEQLEFQKVYTQRMARKGATGRRIYDRIKAAAQWCPLCGHRDVQTLDHHLPKSAFCYLSVSPSNLVPACSDCNKTKASRAPSIADEETLHPYYDNIDNETWLCAYVQPATYPVIEFYVRSPQNWSETLTARVRNHFQTFGLNFLYGKQAINELADVRHMIGSIYEAEGPNGVRQHLELQARSRSMHRRNYWATALYGALAASDWYCAGGFE